MLAFSLDRFVIVSSLPFQVSDFVHRFGFTVSGFRFQVPCSVLFRVSGSVFFAPYSVLRVPGFRSRVPGPGLSSRLRCGTRAIWSRVSVPAPKRKGDILR